MLRRTAQAGENLNFREAGCLLATIVTRTPPRHSMNNKNKAGKQAAEHGRSYNLKIVFESAVSHSKQF